MLKQLSRLPPLSSFACDVHGVKKELAVQEERGPNQPKGD